GFEPMRDLAIFDATSRFTFVDDDQPLEPPSRLHLCRLRWTGLRSVPDLHAIPVTRSSYTHWHKRGNPRVRRRRYLLSIPTGRGAEGHYLARLARRSVYRDR